MIKGIAIAPAAPTPFHSTYQIGGCLGQDAPTYVERQADAELQTALQRGDFCYVFNARQMGKSSLRVRAKHQLQQAGYRCASIDLSRLGSEHLTPAQWYKGMMFELWRAFDLMGTVDLIAWFRNHLEFPPLQQFGQFVEEILLAHISTHLIIFIDEIDSILSLDFSMDDFFVWIRSCYNLRVDQPDYQRLSFALFGVATPSDLIQDRQRTPFNIGRAIELQGFQLQETEPLMQGLTNVVENPAAVMQEILHWTGGQPLLTQKLCQLVLEQHQATQARSNPAPVTAIAAIESPFLHRLMQEALTHHSEVAVQISTLVQTYVIADWETQDHPEHFRTILHRLLKRAECWPGLFTLYQTLLELEKLPADGSPEQGELLLSGLAIKHAGTLRLRNPIYAAIFNLDWLRQMQQQQQPAPLHPTQARQLNISVGRSQVNANSPHCTQNLRIPTPVLSISPSETTTAAFCDALIDHLEQISPSEMETLAQAIAQAITQRSSQAAAMMVPILLQQEHDPSHSPNHVEAD